MGTEPLVISTLLDPLKDLIHHLTTYNIGAGDIPLFFCFDEVANLSKPGSGNASALMALRRVTRLFRYMRVWTFLLSTQRPLFHLTRATPEDDSWRIRMQKLERIPPFCSFMVDMEASRRFAINKDAEVSKPVYEFSSVTHMAALGRALLSSFVTSTATTVFADDVRESILRKLFCGLDSYDSKLPIHLFVVMAYRIAIDPCLNKTETVDLEERAVSSHLRWINEVDQKTGAFKSMSLSEPLVSEAAASVLIERTIENDPWLGSITQLYFHFFSAGRIDRGRAGELVSRLLCIMSRDQLFRHDFDREDDPYSVNSEPMVSEIESQEMKHHLQYARPFKVTAFVQALFTDAAKILDTPAQLPDSTEDETITIRKEFATSVMNFTHFVTTSVSLRGNTILQLLHMLLYEQAALQLAYNQETWDLLIPIYCGDIQKPFDESRLAAMVLQVKNRVGKTSLDVSKDRSNYTKIFGKSMPVISILLDVGIQQAECEPSPSYRKKTFAFWVAGHGPGSYASVTPAIKETLSAMLAYDTRDYGIQDNVIRYNMREDYHTWDERYPTNPLSTILKVRPTKREIPYAPPSTRSPGKKRKDAPDSDKTQGTRGTGEAVRPPKKRKKPAN